MVHLHVPRSFAAHFGVAVRAGSSNESPPSEAGLAHFVEHTLFKGTAKRSSWHIINRMEAVGGELNAFTTKEDTVIYSTFPKNALARAIELIVDLILNSRFPENEINKEREVICDEINSYLDSPGDAVYDDFEDLLYRDSPLGHNILGTLDSVRDITGSMCRRWLDRHYHRGNIVVFYAGPHSDESFLRKAEPFLRLIPEGKRPESQSAPWTPRPTFKTARHADTHQAHTVLGVSLPRLDDKDRMTLALITNILGGPGMNSLLNVSLRERRGLVYTVESTMSNWTGSTMFSTYFGTDPEDNERCIALVKSEIESLADGRITNRSLVAAKKQYRGQLVLAREHIENRIIGIARATLLYGNALTLEQTDRLLESVTTDDIKAMSHRILDLSSLTLSPL